MQDMQKLKLEIKQLLIDALDLEDMSVADIDDDCELFGSEGLGLDSIDALELGLALHKKYQLQLDFYEAENQQHFRSLSSLAKLVLSQTSAA